MYMHEPSPRLCLARMCWCVCMLACWGVFLLYCVLDLFTRVCLVRYDVPPFWMGSTGTDMLRAEQELQRVLKVSL